MIDSLRSYEENHPEDCELIEDTNQFYGWSKGANLMSKYVQWVYIPAVKDAATEQDETGKTALGQLLERTVRAKVNFKDPIKELRAKLLDDYRRIVEGEKKALGDLEESIRKRLRRWASPAADLAINWYFDPDKSLAVSEPTARISIGDDDFIGEIPRLGHGMQRSFLLAVLQELAGSEQKGAPTLLLGFEEPELYQHPPQAQHIASTLEQLATSQQTNSQVIVSTHSPYFVGAKGFETIRLIRKLRSTRRSVVRAAKFNQIEKLLARALRGSPGSPTSLIARLEHILQPSQRELFFTPVAILVEGIEDVAFLSTHLHLTQKWDDFRERGCHFIICNGKNSLSRPLAIARRLRIPTFVVFDADVDKAINKERQKHERDNSCILRLCGINDKHLIALPTETFWHDSVVMWKTRIFDEIRTEFGDGIWDAAEAKARNEKGLTDDVHRKNSLLIAATLEQLEAEQRQSGLLTKACQNILNFAGQVG